jgi:hypothetical protein
MDYNIADWSKIYSKFDLAWKKRHPYGNVKTNA